MVLKCRIYFLVVMILRQVYCFSYNYFKTPHFIAPVPIVLR